MLRRIGRPSPALVIACISLFVALGGVGYAAATGSIDGREIKNNSVASKDIKNSSIVGKDVKNNSLTGSDVSESKLGKVPSAANADSAGTANSANTANSAGSAGSVGGLTLRRIRYQANSVSGAQTILNVGGLVLTADCAAGDNVNVTAKTTSNNASIYAVSEELDNNNDGDGDSADDEEGGGLDIGDSFDALVDGDGNPNLVHLVYNTQAGSQVTVNFSADESGETTDCEVYGSAIAG